MLISCSSDLGNIYSYENYLSDADLDSVSNASSTDERQSLEDSAQARAHFQTQHKPVKTPRLQNPFQTQEQEDHFKKTLLRIQKAHRIPVGYGLTDADEEAFQWDATHDLLVGVVRKKKNVSISLPEDTWKPRVLLWLQGLHCMTEIAP
jgi:hypothetical protein